MNVKQDFGSGISQDTIVENPSSIIIDSNTYNQRQHVQTPSPYLICHDASQKFLSLCVILLQGFLSAPNYCLNHVLSSADSHNSNLIRNNLGKLMMHLMQSFVVYYAFFYEECLRVFKIIFFLIILETVLEKSGRATFKIFQPVSTLLRHLIASDTCSRIFLRLRPGRTNIKHFHFSQSVKIRELP